MEVHKEAILFLVGNNDKYKPTARQTKHIRIVVKSTRAVETLTMVNQVEACIFFFFFFFFFKFLLEILQLKDNSDNIKFPIKQPMPVYDLIHSSTQILDKRLCIEMAILREMIERKEIA